MILVRLICAIFCTFCYCSPTLDADGIYNFYFLDDEEDRYIQEIQVMHHSLYSIRTNTAHSECKALATMLTQPRASGDPLPIFLGMWIVGVADGLCFLDRRSPLGPLTHRLTPLLPVKVSACCVALPG